MNSSAADRILAAREGGNVRRVHTAPHVGEYTVGKHSFDLAMLLIILHPNPSAELLKAALMHDIAERWVGDVPGYIKRKDPSIKASIDAAEADHARRLGFEAHEALTQDDLVWLKALDTFELWLWCLDQLAFGNQHVEAIYEDVDTWLKTHPIPEPIREVFGIFRWRRMRHADIPGSAQPHVRCSVCGTAETKQHLGPCEPVNDCPCRECEIAREVGGRKTA